MKSRTVSAVLIVGFAVFFFGCAGVKVNYRLPSVPEEGGIKFTKISGDEDGIGYRITEVYPDGQVAIRPYGVREFFDLSKDGEKIAYMGWKNKKGNIFVKRLAGGKATLQRTFREDIYDVSLSPDGNWIAFADYRDGSWNIYTVGAEAGSAVRQITTSGLTELYPVFSPDGGSILFVQTESQQVDKQIVYRDYLWKYNLENGSLTQYAEGSCPSFHPDGEKVVVNRLNKESATDELWLIDMERGQEFLVASSRDRGFWNASVSPDGNRIACVSETKGKGIPSNLDIYLIDTDGTNLTQITFHHGHDFCPRWSPDGKSIYFLSQRGSEKGEWNIWRMDLR
jgi:Tol biopolymer transport system component